VIRGKLITFIALLMQYYDVCKSKAMLNPSSVKELKMPDPEHRIIIAAVMAVIIRWINRFNDMLISLVPSLRSVSCIYAL